MNRLLIYMYYQFCQWQGHTEGKACKCASLHIHTYSLQQWKQNISNYIHTQNNNKYKWKHIQEAYNYQNKKHCNAEQNGIVQKSSSYCMCMYHKVIVCTCPPTNGSEDDGVEKSGGMIFPWGIFTMVVFSQLIPYMIKSVSDILTNVTYL